MMAKTMTTAASSGIMITTHDNPSVSHMTLEELRRDYEHARAIGKASRFHKSICPKCGELVTNQAMGRAAHMRMHERQWEAHLRESGEETE